MPVSDSEEKPVITGLVALVAVAVVVGLLAGIAALIGTKVTGLGGDSGGSEEAGGGASLVMPKPEVTSAQSGPLVTLVPTDQGDEESSAKKSEKQKKKKKKKAPAITLNAGSTTVSSGTDLYLSGVYPSGEGAVLDIEIKVGDADWTEFPVDVNVSGSTFSTYVNTTKTGPVSWRVVDHSRKAVSNEVKTTYS